MIDGNSRFCYAEEGGRMSDLRKRKLNNSGAALVTVIVCMLFAAIIAAGVLTIAVTNVSFSSQQKKNAANTYSAEQTMDEVKSELKTYADEAYSKAFETTMESYGIVYDGTTIEELFLENFAEEYIEVLLEHGAIAVASSYGADNRTKAANVCERLRTGESVSCEYLGSNVALEMSGDSELVLRDIEFDYRDAENNTTKLKTDLVMQVSFPSVRAAGAGEEKLASRPGADYGFLDYSMIADSNISFENDCINIYGDLYSGGNITVKDCSNARDPGFVFGSERIIARNTVDFCNDSVVKIVIDEREKEKKASGIWADNLKVSGTGDNDIFVQGSCYLNNQLIMNAGGTSTFGMLGRNSGLYFMTPSSTDVAIDIKDAKGRVSLGGTVAGVLGGQIKPPKDLWVIDRPFVSIRGDRPSIENIGNVVTHQERFGLIYVTKIDQEANQWKNGNATLLMKPSDISNLKVSTDPYTAANVTAADRAAMAEYRSKYDSLKKGLNPKYVEPEGTDAWYTTAKTVVDLDWMRTLVGGTSIEEIIHGIEGFEDYEVHRGDINLKHRDFIFIQWGDKDPGEDIGDSTWKHYIATGNVTLDVQKSLTKKRLIVAGGNVTLNCIDHAIMNSFSGIIIAGGNVVVQADFEGIIVAGGNVVFYDGTSLKGTVIAGGEISMQLGNVFNHGLRFMNCTTLDGNAAYINEIANNPILQKVFVASEITEEDEEEPEPTPVTPHITPPAEEEEPEDVKDSYDSISIEYDNWRKY